MSSPELPIEPNDQLEQQQLLESEQVSGHDPAATVMSRRDFGRVAFGAVLAAGAVLSSESDAWGAKANNKKKSAEVVKEDASFLFKQAQILHKKVGATPEVHKLLVRAGKMARENQDLVMFKILDAGREWFQFKEDFVVSEKLKTFVASYPHQNDVMQLNMAAFDASHLMQMGIDFDEYGLVHDVYDHAKETLKDNGYKTQMRDLGKINGRASMLLKEYEPLKIALDAKPADATANLNMGLFYLTKKESSKAFEYLIKGSDQALAELSQDIMDHQMLLQKEVVLQIQDGDRLTQLAERCIAYGDRNPAVKPQLYRVAAACYNRVRGMLPNHPHLADAEKFFARNHQQPMDFNAPRSAYGVEKIESHVNLLAKGHTNGRHLRKGLGGFSIPGMQHEFVAAGKSDGYLMIPFRTPLDSGYVLEMEMLLGDQPEFKFANKYISASRLTFPVADHVLTLIMNERDVTGAIQKDAVLGGLSAIDEQRMPPYARYEDVLRPMKKTPVKVLLRVMPHLNGDGLADIQLQRTDGLTQEWTLPIDHCREDTIYRDNQDGSDHYGVGVGGHSGIRFRRLSMHTFEGGIVDIGDGQMQVANKLQN